MQLRVLPTTDELARATAENFVQTAMDSIADHGRFTVALAGGTTPRATYEMIASEGYAARVDWRRVHVFWGDERCVPPDHEASNFGMARAALLDHVPIPAENVHRMRGEDEPAAAADAYESLIDEIVGDRFDLIHLGLGTDTHIASLFPGSHALHETRRKVCAVFVEDLDASRITVTPVVIKKAAHVTFIVAGESKAEAVARVLQGPRDPAHTPAQIVEPDSGSVVWLIDAAAASLLH